MSEFDYHDYLSIVAEEDIKFVKERDKTYGGSFRESGRTCWHMIKRKLDRIVNMMKRPDLTPENDPTIPLVFGEDHIRKHAVDKYLRDCYFSEDIFAKIKENPSGDDSTMLAELRDLRRYILLTEAFMMSKGVVKEPLQLNIPIIENGYKVNKLGLLEEMNHVIKV
jgi:hypothetical protein